MCGDFSCITLEFCRPDKLSNQNRTFLLCLGNFVVFGVHQIFTRTLYICVQVIMSQAVKIPFNLALVFEIHLRVCTGH